MIPIIPGLVLALLSFICAAFVIFRVLLPILPPHALTKRALQADVAHPSSRSLSPADKSHIWLASLELLALICFIWQVVNESLGGPVGHKIASDPLSSVRLWFIMTIRQLCLLAILAVTLLHVRLGRPVSFGRKHWLLWSPTFLLLTFSTAMAGVLSGAGLNSLFIGLIAFTTSGAIVTTIALGCLVGTLLAIKRNLETLKSAWTPVTQVEAPRVPFPVENGGSLRNGGASWIASNFGAGSRRNTTGTSVWSISTQASQQENRHTAPSFLAKFPTWLNVLNLDRNAPAETPVPTMTDPDPFRRDPIRNMRERADSETSWLTSTDGSRATVSNWSFTVSNAGTTHNAPTPDPRTHRQSAMSFSASTAVTKEPVNRGRGHEVEKGLSPSEIPRSIGDISPYCTIGWLFLIWIPLSLSLPYFIVALQNTSTTHAVTIPFILSVTLPAPILALNIVFCPIPIPIDLFDSPGQTPTRPLSSTSTYRHVAVPRSPSEHNTSCSMTVIDAPSGDVWLGNGNATTDRSKLGRAISMIIPSPKLVIQPTEEKVKVTPPITTKPLDSLPHRTPDPESNSRTRKDSQASSYYSGEDVSIQGLIMVAQRHYSALAHTFVLPGSPEKRNFEFPGFVTSATTGVAVSKPARSNGSHLRTRSAASAGSSSRGFLRNIAVTPPPTIPLPPTPITPSVVHQEENYRESYSSGFTFNQVGNMEEIDELTAGMLPLLIPGLVIGNRNTRESKRMDSVGPLHHPQESAGSRSARHRKNHLSMPSPSLGNDGLHSLIAKQPRFQGIHEHKPESYISTPSNVEIGKRNTVFGSDSVPNSLPYRHEHAPRSGAALSRAVSARSLGLRAEVPHEVETARSSLASIRDLPLSAASSATMFDFEYGSGGSSPQAESTPPYLASTKIYKTAVPSPLRFEAEPRPSPKRRSSIMYIKSDNKEVPDSRQAPTGSVRFATGGGVRPLAPKRGKQPPLQSNETTTKAGPSGRGLRPLSLLYDHNINVGITDEFKGLFTTSSTRPLEIGKKTKPSLPQPPPIRKGAASSATTVPTSVGENTRPVGAALDASHHRNLKPLQLVRSQSSKLRGQLRQNEVLPQVVVQPPSDE